MDELCRCVAKVARLAVSVHSPVSSLWCSYIDSPVSSGASEKVCGSSSDLSDSCSDSGEGGCSQGVVSEGTGGSGTVVDVVDDR